MAIRSTLPLALAAFLLATTVGRAQYWHCPFDGDAVLAVEPRDAETGKMIPGLRVTLHMGEPDQTSFRSDGPLRLYDIRDSLSAANPFYRQHPLPEFVPADRYVQVVGMHIPTAGSFVEVEDIDGSGGGGVYERTVVPIDDSDLIPICFGYWYRFDSTVYRPQGAGPVEAPPVVVIELRRRVEETAADPARSVAIESAKGILH